MNPAGCNGAEHGRYAGTCRPGEGGQREAGKGRWMFPTPKSPNLEQPPPAFLIFASRSSRTLETQGAAAIMPGCTTIPAVSDLLSFSLPLAAGPLFPFPFDSLFSSSNLSLNKARENSVLILRPTSYYRRRSNQMPGRNATIRISQAKLRRYFTRRT